MQKPAPPISRLVNRVMQAASLGGSRLAKRPWLFSTLRAVVDANRRADKRHAQFVILG